MTVIHIVAADAGTTGETMTQDCSARRIPGVSYELNGKRYEVNDDAVARMRAHWNRDQRGWWRR